MTLDYKQQDLTSTIPGLDYIKVTKSDTADLVPGPCRGLLCGVAGSANLMTMDGSTRSAVPLQAGFNPIRAKRVLAGGTADNIWAVY